MTIRYFEDKGINPPKLREVLALGFTYPGLPPKTWNPNDRDHWKAKNADQDVVQTFICENLEPQYIEMRTHVHTKENRKPKFIDFYRYREPPVDNPLVSIRWGLPDKRARDWDNLIAATKPMIDALVKLEIIRNDSVRDYTPRYGWFDSPKKPLTEIKVYRLEYDD